MLNLFSSIRDNSGWKDTQMKKQRAQTVFLLFSVLSLSSVLPGQADTWVTVNPDGSVTRTTVTTGSGPATNVPASNYAPGQNVVATPSGTRNKVTTRGYSVSPYPNGGYAYPGQYSQPYYPPAYYPQPYYPPAPIYNQYYYPPAQAYSGPLHPVPSYATPPWITSIPLGTTYSTPGYPGYYNSCQPCAVCRCYPCRCSSYGAYGNFSIGGSGVTITIGGGRQRTTTTTTTTTTTSR
jgi:hypothetical protein